MLYDYITQTHLKKIKSGAVAATTPRQVNMKLPVVPDLPDTCIN